MRPAIPPPPVDHCTVCNRAGHLAVAHWDADEAALVWARLALQQAATESRLLAHDVSLACRALVWAEADRELVVWSAHASMLVRR